MSDLFSWHIHGRVVFSLDSPMNNEGQVNVRGPNYAIDGLFAFCRWNFEIAKVNNNNNCIERDSISWIPDSKAVDSGFHRPIITWIPESRSRITLHEATRILAERFKRCFVDGCLLNLISFFFFNPWFDVLLHCTAVHKHHGRSLKSILHNWKKKYVDIYFLLATEVLGK